MWIRPYLLLAALLAGGLAVDEAAAASSLKITRNGVTTTLAAPAAYFSATGDQENLQIVVTMPGQYHWVELSAPRGQSLARGVYSKAERVAFRTGRAPGIDYGANGSGCNQVWGSFTIRQIGFDDTGRVNLLDATISHRCEASTAPPTTLTLLLNAEPWNYAYASTAGDYLGQGLKHTFLGHTSDFALTGTADGLQYAVSGDREDWMLQIYPPTGTALAVGTYTTARFADFGVAGLDVGGNGRGCNASTGSLRIRDLRTDEDGDITGLYATYTVVCDSSTGTHSGTIHWFR